MTQPTARQPALCVFCGSHAGLQPGYATMTRRLGEALVREGLALVYGGGNIGLMGLLATTVLEQGGTATGVIPRHLEARALLQADLTTTHIVSSMHERKALMETLSDGFISLPGGFGTLEECCEMLTWAQLQLHRKPCGLLNCFGFFDNLLNFFDHQLHEGFVMPATRDLVLVDSNPENLVQRIKAHIAVT